MEVYSDKVLKNKSAKERGLSGGTSIIDWISFADFPFVIPNWKSSTPD